MLAHIKGHDIAFDQTGTGPAILFLHDDAASQEALFRDCAPLAASKLRVVVAVINPAASGSTQVLSLMKFLGIGRAVVIAVGEVNHTLLDLLEKHPERIAGANFVADGSLAGTLRDRTSNPHIHDLLRSGRRASIARAVARSCSPATAYGAVRAWSGRMVESCRTGIRTCSSLLARLELPGLIQFDAHSDDDEAVSEAL